MIHSIPHFRDPSHETLERTIFHKPEFGIECMFIHMSAKKGIKVYPSKRAAKYAYARQGKAAKHGIAPQVLSPVKKCYFTFHSEDRYGTFKHNQRYAFFFFTEVAKIRALGQNALEYLQKKLRDLGMHTIDLHSRNVGRIGKRPVVVDFGKESVE